MEALVYRHPPICEPQGPLPGLQRSLPCTAQTSLCTCRCSATLQEMLREMLRKRQPALLQETLQRCLGLQPGWQQGMLLAKLHRSCRLPVCLFLSCSQESSDPASAC